MEEALSYAMDLRGKPYAWWKGGPIQTGSPMWAEDEPAPLKQDIIAVNCAGLTNLMLRIVGRSLPYHVSTGRGGTGAYGVVYGPIAVAFDIEESYPRGSLLLRRYRDEKDQGHVAVVLDGNGKKAKVLQSHSWGKELPGVNADYTVEVR